LGAINALEINSKSFFWDYIPKEETYNIRVYNNSILKTRVNYIEYIDY
jgi:hypothetical protein